MKSRCEEIFHSMTFCCRIVCVAPFIRFGYGCGQWVEYIPLFSPCAGTWACDIPGSNIPAIFHAGASGGNIAQLHLQVPDVARILALGFVEVPDGNHQGELHPFLYVEWCSHFNVLDHLHVPTGERAGTQRCVGILQDMGVEAVRTDPHEFPVMLTPSHVSSLVYLQHGWYRPQAGPPDFYWIDTTCDKM